MQKRKAPVRAKGKTGIDLWREALAAHAQGDPAALTQELPELSGTDLEWVLAELNRIGGGAPEKLREDGGPSVDQRIASLANPRRSLPPRGELVLTPQLTPEEQAKLDRMLAAVAPAERAVGDEDLSPEEAARLIARLAPRLAGISPEAAEVVERLARRVLVLVRDEQHLSPGKANRRRARLRRDAAAMQAATLYATAGKGGKPHRDERIALIAGCLELAAGSLLPEGEEIPEDIRRDAESFAVREARSGGEFRECSDRELLDVMYGYGRGRHVQIGVDGFALVHATNPLTAPEEASLLSPILGSKAIAPHSESAGVQALKRGRRAREAKASGQPLGHDHDLSEQSGDQPTWSEPCSPLPNSETTSDTASSATGSNSLPPPLASRRTG